MQLLMRDAGVKSMRVKGLLVGWNTRLQIVESSLKLYVF